MTAQTNSKEVKFGVLLPTREAVMSGRSDPSLLYQIAERAETLGFHSLWVGDSLTARPRIDALTTLQRSARAGAGCGSARQFSWRPCVTLFSSPTNLPALTG